MERGGHASEFSPQEIRMRSLDIQETLQKEASDRHANVSEISQPLQETGLLTVDCCRWACVVIHVR